MIYNKLDKKMKGENKMKLLKKLSIIILMVSTFMVIPVVFTNLNATSVVQAASVKINKTKKTIEVGNKYTLKITGTSKKVKWKSSNKKVATVNSKGKVTAKKAGKTTITAKVGNKKLKCKITVKKASVLKVGKHTLKYGKYECDYKDSIGGGTFTINKDGTFSWVCKWKNFKGIKYKDTGSGKYKVYYSKGDEYDSTKCWIIKFNFSKYHSTYEPANSYPYDYLAFDVTKNNQFQYRQSVGKFTYKGK